MGILDGLDVIKHQRPCRVRAILDELDKSDKQILNEALADEAKFSHYKLSIALNKRNVHASEDAIRRHRNGICSCLRG